MVTVSKNFVGNTKYFVNCKDCMFFLPQLHIGGGDGYCQNKWLFKMMPYYKKYNGIYDSVHTGCGCSLPKNINIPPEVYFNQDNSNDDPALRQDI